ncbi:ImuA family protein [Hoeflea ulvae]|uniref:DNA repair protein n=1 Tax=Hoeflea ulvae TaxID=2983764 RepID=A0ABT3YBQ7_9HYPH|nr:DNA repair protein [Hoeflea ulvae]MCY0093307.1 DNA repair protein [Hoeflea ulvae]
MSLSRLQTATDILKARTRAYEAEAHRGMGLGDAAVSPPLALGASVVDLCLDGGLACGGLHEVRVGLARDIAAGSGFALGLAARAIHAGREGAGRGRQGIVWVTDPATRVDGGGLFPAGLAQYGLDPSRVTCVEPGDLQGAMWAADEAAGCAGLAALVFQIKGNPARFDITATRRLMLRARQSGVLALVLRQSGEEEASAAVTRWCVNTEMSGADETFERGVGAMRLSLTLERNRAGRTGQWLLAWNPKARSFDHAAPHTTDQRISGATPPAHSLDRIPASADRRDSAGKMGQVLDHRQDFGRAS